MSKWILRGSNKDIIKISDKYGISPILTKLLLNRGIDESVFNKFINAEFSDLNDFDNLSDIAIAIDIINRAIVEGKKIRIVGDYDVDGICSTTILYRGLHSLGANVDFAVPNRENDGYGINPAIVKRALEDNIELIITCDNGIAAFDAIDYANDNFIDVIITDHHNIPIKEINGEFIEDLPKAKAIVNPKLGDYKFKNICGAFVAYKLIEAMYAKNDREFIIQNDLILLAGFATVCDVMPLVDENRILVKKALKQAKRSDIIGFNTLAEIYNVDLEKISTFTFGFILGPALNSSGRLSDASLAIELLVTEEHDKAYSYAYKLKELNDKRQKYTEEALEEALNLIENNKIYEKKIMCIMLENSHNSIAGIVAGRIKELYNRPTLVFVKNDEYIVGSGRSIEKYNLFEALSYIKDKFIKCGGHKLAAGFTAYTDKFCDINDSLNENCVLTDEDIVPIIYIDNVLDFKYINIDLIRQISELEPYGVGNTKPLFATKNIQIKKFYRIGKEKQYLKLYLNQDKYTLVGMLFKNVDEMNKIIEDKCSIDIVFSLQINEWNGTVTPQIMIEDFRINNR